MGLKQKEVEAAHGAISEVIRREPAETMLKLLHQRPPPSAQAKEQNVRDAVPKTREYIERDVVAMGAQATRMLQVAIFIAKGDELKASATEARNIAKDLARQPGALRPEYFISLALGYEKLASQYKEMADLSAAGRTREALSRQKATLASEFVLNSARVNYLFVADMGSRFSNAQALDQSFGFSSVTQDLVKALVPVQRQASDISVRTNAIVQATVSGGKTAADNVQGILSLANSVQKAQGDYAKISEGVAACTHLLAESAKLGQMADAMMKKDRFAGQALQSTAEQMKSFAHSAILSPHEFAEAYRKNGMFGGEFSLKDRVDDAFIRAYTSIGSLAYGKAAAGIHPLWSQFAEVEIAKFSLALSPVAPKPETAEKSNQVARYAWNDILQFEGQAFRVAMEGKVLSSDLQLSALNALSKSVVASSSRYAAAIKGDFAAAAKHAQASADAEREFITSFSSMQQVNMHLNTAGRLFHGAALVVLPAIGVADAFTLIAKNHRQMSAGQIALAAGGAMLPYVAGPLLGRIMKTRFMQTRVLPKVRSAWGKAETKFQEKLAVTKAVLKAGREAYVKSISKSASD